MAEVLYHRLRGRFVISKNVPHSYITNGMRYFVCLHPVLARTAAKPYRAWNFYIFDEEGYCWAQLIHTTRAFIFQAFPVLKTKALIEVSAERWANVPLVESDMWVQGSPDRGYALEVLREALGLNLTYLTEI